jgi:hypothetical protein
MTSSKKVLVVKKIIRRVRGGSQGFLVEGADGHFYVAKCIGNPQGNRTLINDVLGAKLLEKLAVATPSVRYLQIPPEAENAEEPFVFIMGDRRVPISSGPHFGSRYPVNPMTTAVFDYLPKRMVEKVVNRDDFAKTFAVDHILGQVDTRQAVFARTHHSGSKGLHAYMIDHGFLLEGDRWALRDNIGHAAYLQTSVYPPNMLDICLRAVPVIFDFILNDWLKIIDDVPPEWRRLGDFEAWKSLRSRLLAREKYLPVQMEQHVERITEQSVFESRKLINSAA